MSKVRGSGIVGRAVRGAIAGAVGLTAMDVLLYSRYRRGGGKDPFLRWEFAGAVLGWSDASAPGQLGQKVERIVTRRQPPERWARTTTNVVHWATGIGWAAQYGVLAGRSTSHPAPPRAHAGPSGVAVRLRDPASGRRLQADLGVRRANADRRPVGPSRIRRDDQRDIRRSHAADAKRGKEQAMDLRLEVVILPVTDVDKAKHFYETGLDCRLDADVSPQPGYRIVQVTPPGSPARSSSATA